MAKAFAARYSGRCARTGHDYPIGTMIVKVADKSYAIAPGAHVAEWCRVRIAEYQGRPAVEKDVDLARPLYCACSKDMPGFDPEKPETGNAFVRDGDTLHCPYCGRTGEILPPAPPVKIAPETKTCWECGCSRTYHEVRAAGGDWNDGGPGECYCGC